MAYQTDAPLPMRDQNTTHHHVAVDTTTGEITKIIGGTPETFYRPPDNPPKVMTEIEKAEARRNAERQHYAALNKEDMAKTLTEYLQRLRALKGGGATKDDQTELEEIYKMIQELLLQLGLGGRLQGLEHDTPTCTEEPKHQTDAHRGHRGASGLSVADSLAKIRQDQERRDAFAARLKERSAVVHDGAPDKPAPTQPSPRNLEQHAAYLRERSKAIHDGAPRYESAPTKTGRMDVAAYQRMIEEHRASRWGRNRG